MIEQFTPLARPPPPPQKKYSLMPSDLESAEHDKK